MTHTLYNPLKMKEESTRSEQIAKGLQGRIDQINILREQQIGYATSLYINEHVTSDMYCAICDNIHAHYNAQIEASNKLAYKIRNS